VGDNEAGVGDVGKMLLTKSALPFARLWYRCLGVELANGKSPLPDPASPHFILMFFAVTCGIALIAITATTGRTLKRVSQMSRVGKRDAVLAAMLPPKLAEARVLE
jgi:hypothetical protein